jgi:hypothetical protein
LAIRYHFSMHGVAASLSRHYFSFPIDTWSKPGIYSPHLKFRPSVYFVGAVVNDTKGARDFQPEGFCRSRFCERVNLRLPAAGRPLAPGKKDATVLPNQFGRSETDLCPAWESGSPLLRSKRSSPPQPDLPGFKHEWLFMDEEPNDVSDIASFLALRHGIDFTAIRRGQ